MGSGYKQRQGFAERYERLEEMIRQLRLRKWTEVAFPAEVRNYNTSEARADLAFPSDWICDAGIHIVYSHTGLVSIFSEMHGPRPTTQTVILDGIPGHGGRILSDEGGGAANPSGHAYFVPVVSGDFGVTARAHVAIQGNSLVWQGDNLPDNVNGYVGFNIFGITVLPTYASQRLRQLMGTSYESDPQG